MARLKIYADDVHPHAAQLGKNPAPLITWKPKAEETLMPTFEGMPFFYLLFAEVVVTLDVRVMSRIFVLLTPPPTPVIDCRYRGIHGYSS